MLDSSRARELSASDVAPFQIRVISVSDLFACAVYCTARTLVKATSGRRASAAGEQW